MFLKLGHELKCWTAWSRVTGLTVPYDSINQEWLQMWGLKWIILRTFLEGGVKGNKKRSYCFWQTHVMVLLLEAALLSYVTAIVTWQTCAHISPFLCCTFPKLNYDDSLSSRIFSFLPFPWKILGFSQTGNPEASGEPKFSICAWWSPWALCLGLCVNPPAKILVHLFLLSVFLNFVFLLSAMDFLLDFFLSYFSVSWDSTVWWFWSLWL